jgi:hypothetical protein
MRVFGFGCIVLALLLAVGGIYALVSWPARLYWLFWIVAMFLFLWGYNCLNARNSDDHDDSPLHAIIQAARRW